MRAIQRLHSRLGAAVPPRRTAAAVPPHLYGRSRHLGVRTDTAKNSALRGHYFKLFGRKFFFDHRMVKKKVIG